MPLDEFIDPEIEVYVKGLLEKFESLLSPAMDGRTRAATSAVAAAATAARGGRLSRR